MSELLRLTFKSLLPWCVQEVETNAFQFFNRDGPFLDLADLQHNILYPYLKPGQVVAKIGEFWQNVSQDWKGENGLRMLKENLEIEVLRRGSLGMTHLSSGFFSVFREDSFLTVQFGPETGEMFQEFHQFWNHLFAFADTFGQADGADIIQQFSTSDRQVLFEMVGDKGFRLIAVERDGAQVLEKPLELKEIRKYIGEKFLDVEPMEGDTPGAFQIVETRE